MNKAIQLNECAKNVNDEKRKKRIEYTQEWINTVLFPTLNHSAELGNYKFDLHKIDNYGTETWVFEGLTHSKEGLDVDLVFKILTENGFHIEEHTKTAFTISWEDKYVY